LKERTKKKGEIWRIGREIKEEVLEMHQCPGKVVSDVPGVKGDYKILLLLNWNANAYYTVSSMEGMTAWFQLQSRLL